MHPGCTIAQHLKAPLFSEHKRTVALLILVSVNSSDRWRESLKTRQVDKANILKCFSIKNQEVSVFCQVEKDLSCMSFYFSGSLVGMENSIKKNDFVSESLSKF